MKTCISFHFHIIFFSYPTPPQKKFIDCLLLHVLISLSLELVLFVSNRATVIGVSQ